MNSPQEWLSTRTDGAPELLRGRVERWVAAEDGAGEVDATLADAGLAALRTAVGQPGDRSVALDLLAADALVTLALLHRAEHDPAGLAGFARQVRMLGASTA